MTFPHSSSPSLSSLSPVRFSTTADYSIPACGNTTRTSDAFLVKRLQKSSVQGGFSKGKQPLCCDEVGIQDGSNSISPTSNTSLSRRTSLFSVYARSSIPEGSAPRKPRAGLLTTASGALGFKFGRKKHSLQNTVVPNVLPGVLEIKPSQSNDDVLERNRLRDMAAQSIGIPVHPHNHSLEGSSEEEGHSEMQCNVLSSVPDTDNRQFSKAQKNQPSDMKDSPLHNSNFSAPVASSTSSSRLRSGSLLGHSRTNSTVLTSVPSFPTTHSMLTQLKQWETNLCKLYPPSSLRFFAANKNWKVRCMVLSSPTAWGGKNSSPPVSYLHLFKSPNEEELEMERLEINEDSVVFVAEKEVGGRKNVVKVAGVDVGALKKELNHEEGGRTMWFLHLSDPNEVQKWINVIKSAIFGQRTMRAGLGPPSGTFSGIEPLGDMDVMLSIRAQGLINRVSQGNASTTSQQDRNYASSINSHRSLVTVPKSTSSGAASAIKGLFMNASRQRSPSRATSVDSQHDHDSIKDKSFHCTGSHSTSEKTMAWPLAASKPVQICDRSIPSAERRLDQRIIPNGEAISPTSDSSTREGDHRTFSIHAISLQPPPRKHWTSSEPPQDITTPASSNEEVSAKYSTSHKTDFPSTISRRSDSPLKRSVTPTVQYASTSNSGDNAERMSAVPRCSKRWSRQGVRPRRLTPPSGPPPSVPIKYSNTSVTPTHLDRTPSGTSSTHSLISRQSIVSSLPSFSKRTSGSSFVTSSFLSNSSSASIPRPASSHSHRTSIPPPPHPPPTSALPPAPNSEHSAKVSGIPPKFLRDSATHRAARFSVMKAPFRGSNCNKAESLTALRRHSSGGYQRRSSAIPDIAALSPFPPPAGPLPPTPEISDQTKPAALRRTLIKHRLRILSAPTFLPPFPLDIPSAENAETGNKFPSSPIVRAVSPVSLPSTPIAEKISHDDDLSFLQLITPVGPTFPPSRAPPPPRPYPELSLTPLSPPPRRHSKQISTVEVEAESHVNGHPIPEPSTPKTFVT